MTNEIGFWLPLILCVLYLLNLMTIQVHHPIMTVIMIVVVFFFGKAVIAMPDPRSWLGLFSWFLLIGTGVVVLFSLDFIRYQFRNKT